jgi:hypothetical protein
MSYDYPIGLLPCRSERQLVALSLHASHVQHAAGHAAAILLCTLLRPFEGADFQVLHVLFPLTLVDRYK